MVIITKKHYHLQNNWGSAHKEVFFVKYFEIEIKWCLTIINSQVRGTCIFFQNSISSLFQTLVLCLLPLHQHDYLVATVEVISQRFLWGLSRMPLICLRQEISNIIFPWHMVYPCCPFRNEYLYLNPCPGTRVFLARFSGVGKMTLSTYLTGLSMGTDIKQLGIKVEKC